MCTALPDLSQVFYNKVTNSSLPYTEIGALLSLESLVALWNLSNLLCVFNAVMMHFVIVRAYKQRLGIW